MNGIARTKIDPLRADAVVLRRAPVNRDAVERPNALLVEIGVHRIELHT